jgi:hypothetical protein
MDYRYFLPLVAGVCVSVVYFFVERQPAHEPLEELAPSPIASADAERAAWRARRKRVMEWCELEEKGTVVMGFGYEIICIEPQVATITYDQERERWTREGRVETTEPKELRDGGVR